jgi:hypothetical protein
MNYDRWKTTEPEPSEECDECECCGKRVPSRQLRLFWEDGPLVCAECCGPDQEPAPCTLVVVDED